MTLTWRAVRCAVAAEQKELAEKSRGGELNCARIRARRATRRAGRGAGVVTRNVSDAGCCMMNRLEAGSRQRRMDGYDAASGSCHTDVIDLIFCMISDVANVVQIFENKATV